MRHILSLLASIVFFSSYEVFATEMDQLRSVIASMHKSEPGAFYSDDQNLSLGNTYPDQLNSILAAMTSSDRSKAEKYLIQASYNYDNFSAKLEGIITKLKISAAAKASFATLSQFDNLSPKDLLKSFRSSADPHHKSFIAAKLLAYDEFKASSVAENLELINHLDSQFSIEADENTTLLYHEYYLSELLKNNLKNLPEILKNYKLGGEVPALCRVIENATVGTFGEKRSENWFEEISILYENAGNYPFTNDQGEYTRCNPQDYLTELAGFGVITKDQSLQLSRAFEENARKVKPTPTSPPAEIKTGINLTIEQLKQKCLLPKAINTFSYLLTNPNGGSVGDLDLSKEFSDCKLNYKITIGSYSVLTFTLQSGTKSISLPTEKLLLYLK